MDAIAEEHDGGGRRSDDDDDDSQSSGDVKLARARPSSTSRPGTSTGTAAGMRYADPTPAPSSASVASAASGGAVTPTTDERQKTQVISYLLGKGFAESVPKFMRISGLILRRPMAYAEMDAIGRDFLDKKEMVDLEFQINKTSFAGRAEPKPDPPADFLLRFVQTRVDGPPRGEQKEVNLSTTATHWLYNLIYWCQFYRVSREDEAARTCAKLYKEFEAAAEGKDLTITDADTNATEDSDSVFIPLDGPNVPFFLRIGEKVQRQSHLNSVSTCKTLKDVLTQRAAAVDARVVSEDALALPNFFYTYITKKNKDNDARKAIESAYNLIFACSQYRHTDTDDGSCAAFYDAMVAAGVEERYLTIHTPHSLLVQRLTMGGPVEYVTVTDTTAPAEYTRRLLALADNGETAELAKTLQGMSNKAPVNGTDAFGRTPLHLAARRGAVEVARLLVEEGDALVDKCAANGWNALYFAAYHGVEAMTRYLMERGADSNATDRDGMAAVHIAAIRWPRVCEVLHSFSRVDMNAKAAGGWTPLMFAAYSGQQETVQMLLAWGVDVGAVSAAGKTAADYGSRHEPIRRAINVVVLAEQQREREMREISLSESMASTKSGRRHSKSGARLGGTRRASVVHNALIATGGSKSPVSPRVSLHSAMSSPRAESRDDFSQ